MYVDERVQKCFGLYSKFIKAYTYFSMNWRIIQNDALWLGFLYRFPDSPGLNSLSFLLIANLLFECKIVGCRILVQRSSPTPTSPSPLGLEAGDRSRMLTHFLL